MSAKVEISQEDALLIHMYLLSMASGWKQALSQTRPESEDYQNLKKGIDDLNSLIVRFHKQMMNATFKAVVHNIFAN